MARKRKRAITCVEVVAGPQERGGGSGSGSGASPTTTLASGHTVPPSSVAALAEPQPAMAVPLAAGRTSEGGSGLTKAERKQRKRQRQREQKRASSQAAAAAAGGGGGGGGDGGSNGGSANATLPPGSQEAPAAPPPAAAAAATDDLSEIFAKPRATGRQEGDRTRHGSESGCEQQQDGDDEEVLKEGDVVVESMDDLDKIFADKRRKVAAQAEAKRKNAAAAAAAADKTPAAAGGEWSYLSNRAKARRQHEGLNVYTEEEHVKSALEDVRGKLDGPCPFECSCCF
jgi:hypothetical protein